MRASPADAVFSVAVGDTLIGVAATGDGPSVLADFLRLVTVCQAGPLSTELDEVKTAGRVKSGEATTGAAC